MRAVALAFFIVTGLFLNSQANAQDIQKLVIAGGCFWCVEADYESIDGVIEARSGYTGGTTANPTYKKVTRGGTGHYEAVEVTYDAHIVSYRELIDIFWRTVDPTDAGGQFCDRGESYRTAVFFGSQAQADAANASKTEAQKALGKKIVTPILQAARFYPAEAYHQDYYKQSKKIITRYGRITKAAAYKRYRKGCGRDKRLVRLWGDDAFVNKHGS